MKTRLWVLFERGMLAMFSKDIGIDLGTANTLVYMKGKGIVMREPSVVAVDVRTDTVLAVGSHAKDMIGRTPGSIVAVRPLKDGVIADFDITATMLKHFIKKAVKSTAFSRPHIVVCIPSGVTEVERRAVEDAARQAGASQVELIEEPMAAAIGAGLPVADPTGSMVVDIGGGTTDIAVLSLYGVAVSESIKVAGNDFDEAIIRYVRRKYSIHIGNRMAEKLKIEAGTVYPLNEERMAIAKGRNAMNGLPQAVEVTSTDIMEAIEEPVQTLMSAIQAVLEQTPPELIGDIFSDGIVVTGGSALLGGMSELITSKTGVQVRIPEDPISCVVKGTGEALPYIDQLQGGVYNYRTVEDLRK